ncbi:MAG: hypothetical protein ACR2HG_11885 [Pyrinomonadaceae bacterium]
MEAESEKNPKAEKSKTARKNKVAPSVKKASEENFTSELNAPRWSVVSFENRLASHLTYAEAARKLKDFAAKKVSGLCVVTDEVGEKVKIKK